MGEFLVQATVYLAAAVIAVPLAKRLGLGSVLGYLIAGIAIGQVSGFLGTGSSDIQHFAEFGVVMLLFVIGLELEPRTLWDLRHKLIGLGGLQIALTTFLIALSANLLGLPWPESLAIGMTLALSSTAMVLQTLSEKGLTQTNGGRSALSVLLTQDVAVIPMLIVIPLLGLSSVGVSVEPHGESNGPEAVKALVESLPAWGITGIMLASVGVIIIGGRYLSRPLFRYITASGLTEVSTAATLFLVVAAALLMTVVGLSPALGTFLAGVALANSEFRHELESHIAPFKGLLLGLFFITVGASINFGILYQNFLEIIGMTLGLIIVKVCVLLLLARLFAVRGRDQWLFALGLAQAGEFGLVMLSFMQQTGVISTIISENLTLVVAMSMVLTPALFIGYEQLARRIGDPVDRRVSDEIKSHGPIIIAGVGRFGQVVNELVSAHGYKTTVLDADMKTIGMMRRLGFKAFLGDPTRPQLIEAAGLQDAEALVVAIDMPEKVNELVIYARRRRPDLYIIARAHNRAHVFDLYQAGASDIIRETFDSSLRAGRYVLQKMGIPEEEAHRRTRAFFRFDRNSMRELAAVWDPNIPIEKNEAYIQRVKDLNREIESGLASLNKPNSITTDGLFQAPADVVYDPYEDADNENLPQPEQKQADSENKVTRLNPGSSRQEISVPADDEHKVRRLHQRK